MSSKSWYALATKAVPARYGLSQNMQTLLRALEQHHAGALDANGLGRLVRLSPSRRNAIAITISKCAQIMKKDASEAKTCIQVIESCTEILQVADRLNEAVAFPFMNLPVEIREMVWKLCIYDIFPGSSIVPAKYNSCSCVDNEYENLLPNSNARLIPVLLAEVHSESTQFFYKKKQFRFRCCCEMYKHLTSSTCLKDNIRHIIVHWQGLKAPEAFEVLNTLPKLESLTLRVSKFTIKNLSERATLMNQFFSPSPGKGLIHALGLDELLEIRGLQTILVVPASMHVPRQKLPYAEMHSLKSLLDSRLRLPKFEEL